VVVHYDGPTRKENPMKKARSRKIERSKHDFDKGLNEVNKLSVAEMLNEMAKTLDLLRDCEFLNASQRLHVAEGSDAIHAAIVYLRNHPYPEPPTVGPPANIRPGR